MNTTSRIRREGREAFIPGEDAVEHNPYTSGGRYTYAMGTWLEGWAEALKDHNEEQEAIQAEDDEFFHLSCNCPWDTGDGCISGRICSKENCAPWYFS